MPKKIAILTTGQPSTNPRMLKEYISLKKANYDVKVFYCFWQEWATKADATLFEDGVIRKEDFILVGGSPKIYKLTYIFSKILHKVGKFFYKKHGRLKFYALSRVAPYLIRSAKSNYADLYIAHNVGALPAAVIASRKYNSLAAFDAEDFHRGEFYDQLSRDCKLVIDIENFNFPYCGYITTASPLISKKYKEIYSSLNFYTINNVFSKIFLNDDKLIVNKDLKLFWFSQTVGAKRGLELVISAMNILGSDLDIELFLMGEVSDSYKESLMNLSITKKIRFLQPVTPNQVFETAARFDIGLCLEITDLENRNLCLTNKIFTYLLAGNCIIFSATEAQSEFLRSFPKIGYLFEEGSQDQLVEILRMLYHDKRSLLNARENALALARDKMNWETESKTFLEIIQHTIDTE